MDFGFIWSVKLSQNVFGVMQTVCGSSYFLWFSLSFISLNRKMERKLNENIRRKTKKKKKFDDKTHTLNSRGAEEKCANYNKLNKRWHFSFWWWWFDASMPLCLQYYGRFRFHFHIHDKNKSIDCVLRIWLHSFTVFFFNWNWSDTEQLNCVCHHFPVCLRFTHNVWKMCVMWLMVIS